MITGEKAACKLGGELASPETLRPLPETRREQDKKAQGWSRLAKRAYGGGTDPSRYRESWKRDERGRAVLTQMQRAKEEERC
jgi:hypothetical protein